MGESSAIEDICVSDSQQPIHTLYSLKQQDSQP